jgi:hypothetical protein
MMVPDDPHSSITPHCYAPVVRVGAVFRDEFAALGFETRWIDMPSASRRPLSRDRRRLG